jgi:hypothetical protein
MMGRGFVDLMFILLCSTIVLLAQSIPLRGLLAEPAVAGIGGTRPIDGVDVVLVSIDASTVSTAEHTGSTLDALELPRGPITLILLPATSTVSHHRVIDVWRTAQASGYRVELGVKPGGGS